jgi:hypothetical protein
VAHSELQAVLTDAVTVAPIFTEREEWAVSTLTREYTGDEVWDQRLRILFAFATEVKVVDPYSISPRQWTGFGSGNLTKSSRAENSVEGLPWLLKQIATVPLPANTEARPKLTAFVESVAPPYAGEDGIEELADILWTCAGGNLREFELVYVDDTPATRGIWHDRYLRFVLRGQRQSSRLVMLGNSLDKFSNRPIAPDIAFTYKTQSGDERGPSFEFEERLSENARLSAIRSA